MRSTKGCSLDGLWAFEFCSLKLIERKHMCAYGKEGRIDRQIRRTRKKSTERAREEDMRNIHIYIYI